MRRERFLHAPVYRLHGQELESADRTYLKGKLFGIGFGIKPYFYMMRTCIAVVNLFGTAFHIPAAQASFDSAICTCVGVS